MSDTIIQYDKILRTCKQIFMHKNEDYGSSWTVLRPSSLTDQLYIKAARIRSIEEKEEQKVEDDIRDDYKGLINYSIMAIIQLERSSQEPFEDLDKLEESYDVVAEEVRSLLIKKNHDYGEAWRSMRISSMTDLILMKLLRIKRIEENDGKTIISENIESNFQDIINYAAFAHILLDEEAEGIE